METTEQFETIATNYTKVLHANAELRRGLLNAILLVELNVPDEIQKQIAGELAKLRKLL